MSRHPSDTSSVAAASTASSHTTVNSASENWETFEESEVGEEEQPVYDGRRGTPGIGGKRPFGEVNGYAAGPPARPAYGKNMGLGKKMKAMDVDAVILEGHRIASGSEAGWTDEDGS